MNCSLAASVATFNKNAYLLPIKHYQYQYRGSEPPWRRLGFSRLSNISPKEHDSPGDYDDFLILRNTAIQDSNLTLPVASQAFYQLNYLADINNLAVLYISTDKLNNLTSTLRLDTIFYPVLTRKQLVCVATPHPVLNSCLLCTILQYRLFGLTSCCKLLGNLSRHDICFSDL